MKIGVLGTGMVGQTIASKLVTLGHRVTMGSRSAGNEKAVAWVASAGGGAAEGTFADAAAHGEVLFNCTAGTVALQALEAAGADHLAGKILIDVSNALDFPPDMPPVVAVPPTDSIGERIQLAFPQAKVVKALNTVNNLVMVDPARVPGEHDTIICGNDADAKNAVAGYLRDWFGWRNVIDLGDIVVARALEAYISLWLRLRLKLGTSDFNIRVVY